MEVASIYLYCWVIGCDGGGSGRRRGRFDAADAVVGGGDAEIKRIQTTLPDAPPTDAIKLVISRENVVSDPVDCFHETATFDVPKIPALFLARE